MKGAGCLFTSQMLLFFFASLACFVGVCFSKTQRRLQEEQRSADVVTVQYDGISKKGEEILKKEWKVDNPEATILFTKEGKFTYLLSLYISFFSIYT